MGRKGRHIAPTLRRISRGWAIPLTLVISLVMTSIAWADQLTGDADALAVAAPHPNSLNANQQAGTTVEYDLSAYVKETGNANDDVFPGSVLVSVSRSGDWLSSPAGLPATFTFTGYDAGQAGKIRVTVPCSAPNGTSKTMTALLSAGASSNGKSLNPSTVTLTYAITATTPAHASCAPADTTPPVITPSISGTLGNNGWYRSNVTVSWTVTDPESAISSSTGCGTSNITTDTSGTTLTCSATSAGGTTSQSVTIKRDATNPSFTCDAVPSGWQDDDVTLDCSASDGGSGLSTQSTFSLSTSVGDGNEDANAYTGSAAVTDSAGNSVTAGPLGPIMVDRKAPTYTCSPPSADMAWHNGNVSFNCTASDGGSGLATAAAFTLSTSVAPGDETANAATGTETMEDNVGNTATAGPIGGNKIDQKAPSFTCDPVPSGWQADDVTLNCSAADGGSGLSTPSTFSLSTSVGDGNEDANAYTGSAAVTDNVSNSDTAGPFGPIMVDRKAPTYSCEGAPSGWHGNNVTLNCTAYDGGSGPASAAFTVSTNVADGVETDTAYTQPVSIFDNVGNERVVAAIGPIKIDRKKPEITISTPANDANLVLGSLVPSSFSCTDGGSGTASCNGPANVSTAIVGENTFQVFASDAVGNLTSLSRTYYVRYADSGNCLGSPGHQVLQPVNADGSSVFKKGSTVPIKFRVCDAHGNSIGTSGVVTMFKLHSWVSATALTLSEDPVSTTPDTAFRWSATDQQWIFNLNTKNLSANVRYTYVISLNDGTSITFVFSLK